MKSLVNNLQLVYTPFTNQEGEWLWEDLDVREYVKESKLYMIGHRSVLTFEDVELNMEDLSVRFRLKLDEKLSPYISVSIQNHITRAEEVFLELGEKLIRIRDCNNTEKVYLWFTPDKFIFDYWRNRVIVTVDGEFNHRDFTNFELYYVGISIEHDSFSRLFKNAHHGRLKILSNANTKSFGSRLSDELMMFLFDVDITNINVLQDEKDFEEELFYRTEDKNAVFADAEKAFVSLLQTKYNKIKFENYPMGADGLYFEGLTRYVYSIAEDITFYTDDIVFHGDFKLLIQDGIFVEGDTAQILTNS